MPRLRSLLRIWIRLVQAIAKSVPLAALSPPQTIFPEGNRCTSSPGSRLLQPHIFPLFLLMGHMERLCKPRLPKIKRLWITLRGIQPTSWNKRHDVNSYNKYAHTWMTSPVPSNPAAVKGVCVGVADWMMPRAAASRGLLEGVGATLTTA